MANPVTGFKPSNLSVSVQGATTPKITNLSITANVEEAHSLENNLKQLIVRNRNETDTLVSFDLNGTASEYVTLRKNAVLNLSDIEFSSKTLYVKSSIDATIEILELHS